MRDENIEAEKGSSFIPAEFEIPTASARNPPTTLGIASPMSIIRRIRPRCTPLQTLLWKLFLASDNLKIRDNDGGNTRIQDPRESAAAEGDSHPLGVLLRD